MGKIYVDAIFLVNTGVVPVALYWTDGNKYNIDHMSDTRKNSKHKSWRF